jgi:hypothetical protein
MAGHGGCLRQACRFALWSGPDRLAPSAYHSQLETGQKLATIANRVLLASDPTLERRLSELEKRRLLCARACPTLAIAQRVGEKVSIQMEEQPVEYGNVVARRCR